MSLNKDFLSRLTQRKEEKDDGLQRKQKKREHSLTSSHSIIKLNRRLTPASEIPATLHKEFQDAQKHLRECAVSAVKWKLANPESCKASVSKEKIGTIGIAHMQGIRQSMEDRHIATSITIHLQKKTHSIPIYGIFDGHGGAACARYLEQHLAEHLKEHLEKGLGSLNTIEEQEAALFNILKLAFVHLGAAYRKFHRGKDGSTANIAIIFENQLWVANVGDTRAILALSGTALALSEDAKPGLKKYQQDVESRHSAVVEIEGVPRVGGHLATARAVGHSETSSGINPRAKVIKYPLSQLPPGKNFLIIACDGLWDVTSSAEAAKTVHKISHLPPDEIASHLAKKAFQAESTDNLSVLVVDLQAFTPP